MKVVATVLSSLVLFGPLSVQAELPKQIPPTVQFLVAGSRESDFKGIFLSCDLYIDEVADSAVFYSVCRVKGGSRSIVLITSYERYFEEVVIWLAPGFTAE